MEVSHHTRSDMCESILGLLAVTADIYIKKSQSFGRLCELNTKFLTKRIFIVCLFSYLFNAKTKHYGVFQDTIFILIPGVLPQKVSVENISKILRHLVSLPLDATVC